MTHQSIKNRITSGLLTIAILLTMIPVTLLSTSAVIVNTNRVADPSTMDSWKEFFHTSGDISTENAGGVWIDKSVFTNASAFSDYGITKDHTDSFLVALSSMAATMSVTGMSHLPTDSLLVLDISGSMNSSSGDVAEELVTAANSSIAKLLSTNKHNRVGVVLYSGPTTVGGSASANDSVLVLPLGRYTTASDGQYLSYTVSSGDEVVSIDTDVRIEGTSNAPSKVSKTVEGATYIQKGIITALNQFVAEDNSVTIEDPAMGTLQRKPVMILMSDGAPTVGSTSFTSPSSINLGNGSATSAALGFVSQLSVAYAKAKIEEKYKTDSMFYTLGLGVEEDSIAIGVLDPSNTNASTAMNDFWTQYNSTDVGKTVTVQRGGRGQSAKTVTKIETALEQNYTDQYFSANANNLIEVFDSIVSTIQLQSGYFPTLIAENKDLSGYVSFVDRVGEYMTVNDIKGIIIGDHLFSGADLASNFVPGGGSLGTFDAPNALGMEMVAAVRARLGIDSDDTARTLIALAYENGQLSYTDSSNYSNYIGWYANAAGQFLGFYNEGTTVLPEATGNADTDPAFVIRSYGYLGEVDESHGVTESDMMYATVQVRKNITTGEELVTFAVPAALIPIVSYNVTLDKNGTLSDLTVSGADAPIRLVYEIALDDDINSFNVKEKVCAEYLADPHNINADGSVNFYTNRWDHHNVTGYGTVNTYGYFNPSRQNEKYYYLEDAPVYTDQNGTLYTGDTQPAAEETFYRAYKVYEGGSALRTRTVYRALSDAAKATALRSEDGSWYIPKGNVHVNLDGYTVNKTENLTNTLTQALTPFVDTYNHSVNDDGYNFYVGGTLGNNGKLTVIPETGLKLTKQMAEDATAPEGAFLFDLTNLTNPSDSSSYPAWLIKADGSEHSVKVAFTNGQALVELHPDDVLYVGGMTAGDTFRIEERQTADYVGTASGLSETGSVTVNANEIKSVTFVNSNRGKGNLTVTKEVEHDFGQDYQIPADKIFTIKVTLTGFGTANATFKAAHTGASITEITTDENGSFEISLKHDEHFEVFDIPAGTTATVVELDPATGFTPSYSDNGQPGDGVVTVVDASTVSVVVTNDYRAAEVYPVNITVSGQKLLQNQEWQPGYSFEFKLQRLLEDGSFKDLGSATAAYGSTTFRFDNAFADERYTEAGTYYYRVIELEPETPLGGFTYDKTVHSFAVHVGDANMDGTLEITDVIASRPDTTEITAVSDGWNINTEFTNVYSASGNATVTIELNKVISNVGGAEKTLAGYTFGLYDGDTLVLTSPATTERGFARLVLSYSADQLTEKETTFKYLLKEIVPQTIPAGWTYSTLEIPVTVVVSDDGDGTISAVIYTGDNRPDNASTSIEASFTNTYDPTDAQLTVDFVGKELSGREMKDGEFTFAVQQNGTTLLHGTNNSKGEVTFDKALTFDAVGVYYYDVVESSTGGKGVTTDKTVYRLMVTVTDHNGELSASYSILNAVENTVTFKNVYTASPVTHKITGTKTLNGRVLLNDEFTFVLTEQSFNGVTIANPITKTVKNRAGSTDNIVFDEITYHQAGIYVYTVKEQIAEGGSAYGISYDSRTYTVTVTVKDDGEGALYVESQSVSLDSEEADLHFVNDYKANPTFAQFSGEKQLSGKVNNALLGGEYAFELYGSDENWEKGALLETVENGMGGIFSFTKIDFDTAKDQYFIVVEKNGGKTIDGVTYDDTVYRIRVEITDDLKGHLHSTIHIYDSENIPQDKLLFVNVYEISGDASVTLSGNKIINGRDFTGGDNFSFELYDADENYTIGNVPASVVAMGRTTHKYEFLLNFTAADVGKTFYYVVKEQGAGKTVNGLSYSTAEYQIKVVVEDNGIGGIKTTATVENATTSTLNFLNEYAPTTGTTVTLSGTKTLENKDLNGLQFSFLLIESDASWTVGNVLQSKKNNGKAFTFDALRYTAAGDYYYLIAEAEGGNTIDGITYDDTVYRVHVKVTDNLDGTLSYTLSIVKANGNTLSNVNAITFTNVYSVTGTDSVELSGSKTLDGRDWTENDAFIFELYESDVTFEELKGSPVATVTAEIGSGRFVINRSYGTKDIGKTFYYVLMEQNAGKTINGITYSNTKYKISVTVTDDGKGSVKASAEVLDGAVNALNFTNSYESSTTVIDFIGSKILNLISGNRELKANDFSFDLYKTDDTFKITDAAIRSVKNDENGKFAFVDVALDSAGIYHFLIKENSQNPIGGVVYDNTEYHITVTVTDNGKGQLVVSDTAMEKVQGDSTEKTDAIVFVNDYSVTSTNVSIIGNKTILGRDLVEGEFKFVMVEADEQFNALEGAVPMSALNGGDGSFSFDALSFTEAGVYYFVIYEDNSVDAERVTFDDTVYQLTVQVTDDENGKLIASDPIIEKKDGNGTVEAITFKNVYTPKPDDITVDIDVIKTVLNKGSDVIGPEGFEFLLKALTEGVEDITVASDENGKATFTLTFTEDDLGNTYSFTLTEVDSGREGVTYSTAEYTINVAITLDEATNTLVATVTKNDVATDKAVAEFENVYEVDLPTPPETGEDPYLGMWIALMFISGGAALTLFVIDRKKNRGQYR